MCKPGELQGSSEAGQLELQPSLVSIELRNIVVFSKPTSTAGGSAMIDSVIVIATFRRHVECDP